MITLVCRSRNATSACCTDRYNYCTLNKNVTWLNFFFFLSEIRDDYLWHSRYASWLSPQKLCIFSGSCNWDLFSWVRTTLFLWCNRKLPVIAVNFLYTYFQTTQCISLGSSMYTDISSPFPGWFHVLPLLLVTAQLQQVARWQTPEKQYCSKRDGQVASW